MKERLKSIFRTRFLLNFSVVCTAILLFDEVNGQFGGGRHVDVVEAVGEAPDNLLGLDVVGGTDYQVLGAVQVVVSVLDGVQRPLVLEGRGLSNDWLLPPR